MSNNYNYKRKGGIIEVIVWDENYNKEDTFKWNRKDKKLEKAIAQILHSKYGINLSPSAPNIEELKKEAGFFDS